jgi:hypothetical protein
MIFGSLEHAARYHARGSALDASAPPLDGG